MYDDIIIAYKDNNDKLMSDLLAKVDINTIRKLVVMVKDTIFFTYLIAHLIRLGRKDLTPLVLPMMENPEDTSILEEAAYYGHTDLVNTILNTRRVRPTSIAIRNASKTGNVEILKMLLKYPGVNYRAIENIDTILPQLLPTGKTYLDHNSNIYTNMIAIGSGSYGYVYSADSNNYGKVAIKKLNKTSGFVLKEIRMLNKIRESSCNPYIVCLYDYFYIGNHLNRGVYLVYELVTGIELSKYILHNQNLDELSKVTIMRNLAIGLKELHQNNIIHRDIKGENIMVDPTNLKIKYLDLGLSCMLYTGDVETADAVIKWDCTDDIYGLKTGTPIYMAPEVFRIRGNPYEDDYSMIKKSDIYSLGKVFRDIVTGRLSNGIGNDDSDLTDLVVSPFKALINKMLSVNPDDRPSAENICKTLEMIYKGLSQAQIHKQKQAISQVVARNTTITRNLN